MARTDRQLNGHGLDLSNLEHTTPAEINAYLTSRWKGRGPLYDQYATSLMLDYAPDFAKLHWWGAEVFRSLPSDPDTYDPSFGTPNSIQQLHSYMVLGWETGIRNQFRVLHRLGFTRAQFLDRAVDRRGGARGGSRLLAQPARRDDGIACRASFCHRERSDKPNARAGATSALTAPKTKPATKTIADRRTSDFIGIPRWRPWRRVYCRYGR